MKKDYPYVRYIFNQEDIREAQLLRDKIDATAKRKGYIHRLDHTHNWYNNLALKFLLKYFKDCGFKPTINIPIGKVRNCALEANEVTIDCRASATTPYGTIHKNVLVEEGFVNKAVDKIVFAKVSLKHYVIYFIGYLNGEDVRKYPIKFEKGMSKPAAKIPIEDLTPIQLLVKDLTGESLLHYV